MVSKSLQDRINRLVQRIQDFAQGISATYEAVEDATQAERNHIQSNYLPQVIALSEEDRIEILTLLEEQWSDVEKEDGKITEGQRRHRMRWGKATLGFASYLLMPTEMKEVRTAYAVDMVIRISRWYHTNTNLFIRFRPVAQLTVSKAWGDIEGFRE